MRVLLDECVPARLREELPDHAVQTVAEMGWSGIKNGILLRRAEAQFDCFLTVDRNLQFQENLGKLKIAVVVLHAERNDFPNLRPLMAQVRTALERVTPGALVHVHV